MICTFTSVWDDGQTVVTPAEYDEATGEVTAATASEAPYAALVREFITLPDGETRDVCPECHEYVLRTAVGEREELSYGEYTECPNCPKA